MNDINKAMEFAIKKHGPQKYAGLPYKIHLISVINVLLRNGIFPDTLEYKKLWVGAWLHGSRTSNPCVAKQK